MPRRVASPPPASGGRPQRRAARQGRGRPPPGSPPRLRPRGRSSRRPRPHRGREPARRPARRRHAGEPAPARAVSRSPRCGELSARKTGARMWGARLSATRSGLALEVSDLLGLLVRALVRALELLLLLALRLFLTALTMKRAVARHIAGDLLGLSCDLVGDTHCLLLSRVGARRVPDDASAQAGARK